MISSPHYPPELPVKCVGQQLQEVAKIPCKGWLIMTVFSFPKKNPYHWFLIGNLDSSFFELLSKREQPLSFISSEEQLLRELASSKPSLIFLEQNISWAEPFTLIDFLKEKLQAPQILILEKSLKSSQRHLVKKAYRAGVLEVLELPLKKEEWLESQALFMRICEKASRT